MPTYSVWDGTSEKAIRSAQVWDGTTLRALPLATTTQPVVAKGFVAAYSTETLPDSQPPLAIPVPAGVQPGDTCVMVVTAANAAHTLTVAGMSVTGGVMGSGASWIATGTGHSAGGTVTLGGTLAAPFAVAAAWYRGVTSLGTLATATRPSSPTSATVTAPASADAQAGDLIVVAYAEKSGANADKLPPAVPGVTKRGWSPWSSSGVGLPSAWIGDYSAPATARTATYLRSSANGRGLQIRLRY